MYRCLHCNVLLTVIVRECPVCNKPLCPGRDLHDPAKKFEKKLDKPDSVLYTTYGDIG